MNSAISFLALASAPSWHSIARLDFRGPTASAISTVTTIAAVTTTTKDDTKSSGQDDEDAFDDLLGDILGSDYSDDSFMEDESEGYGLDGQVDLNKVSEGDLDRAKKNMNNDFLKNRVRPGDDGYEFDKRVEFAVDEDAASDCSWDESEEEDDE